MTTTAVLFDLDGTLISSAPPDRVEVAHTVVARADSVIADLTRAWPL